MQRDPEPRDQATIWEILTGHRLLLKIYKQRNLSDQEETGLLDYWITGLLDYTEKLD
ncbi:hypothetical protein MAH4_02170 [Sessilibacter sp. MAH4]